MIKKKCWFLIIIFIVLSCNKNRLDRINKLSGFNIPYNSTILIYYDTYDNLSGELTFKVHVEKKELNIFLKKNHFEKIDTLKSDLNSHRTMMFVNGIRNDFSPVEKIYGKNLQILKNEKGTIIVNCDTFELWGLVSCN